MVATLKAKSQVTIPASVVKQAGLKTGDAFDVKYQSGNIVLKPMVLVAREEATDMLESYSEFGEAEAKKAEIVAKYIRNNAKFIRKNDYTQETMECEQEHLYK